jgi:tetratricopeptide (TPR) repeat protein
VFRHLVEEGKVFDEAGEFRTDIAVDELDVPESVRLVVGRRLERLGPEAQKVLAAGAVVGRGFPFSLLEEIVDTDADRLLDIVEEAEAAKVIVPEPRGGDVYYSYAHELIRQTLLSGLSLLRRQRLHLAVANAIERTDPSCGDTRPSELAHHLLQAGAGADTERTLGYLERTAGRAMDAAAFEEALRAIDDALSLVDDSDETRRAKLLERKGWTVRALGDFEQCIAIWQGILPVYERTGQVEAAARLCWELGYQLIWLNRFAEAFATYARGVEMLGERRSAARATLLGSTAALLGLGGSFDAAEAQFAEALALAEELGDARALGRIHWGRTMSYWSNLRLEQAVESGRAAIEHAQRAEDPWTLVDAAAWTSYPLNYSGRTQEGRRLAQMGVEVAVKIGHLGGELLARRGIAGAQVFDQPELDDLERRARDDLERLASIRSPWVSQAHAWVSAILLLRGALDESLRYADDAIALEPESAWSGVAWAAKFSNRAMAHDLAGCRTLLDEAADLLTTDGADITTGRWMMVCAAAQGCSMLGFTEDAAALYPVTGALADELPISNFWDVTLTHRVAGMAAAAAHRWEEAEQHFETASRLVDELPNPLELPNVLHWHAAMLLDRGDPDDCERARAMLVDALAGYRRYGMPLYEAMVEQRLG